MEEAVTRRAPKGSIGQFFALLFVSNDTGCIQWPFNRNQKGYGQFSNSGRTKYAHRFVCETVHGSQPTPSHQVAHNCGNGHMGCVNPRHLRWATPSENANDKLAHGTMMFGERSARSKLTRESVEAIRTLKASGLTERELCREFGISRSQIGRVFRRECWARL